ncbi:MAG TPA: hypothetical protein DEA55_04280 [Rhodospirillaceae bacterium]|nr:hypothetical protein [Rhodospirillaceae bacterium]
MTIKAHDDDETVCVVTKEAEIVPELRNPLTRAVFYSRPKLTKLFTATGNIVARKDQKITSDYADYFNNPFAERYDFFRKLDLNGDWRQVYNKTSRFGIKVSPEIAEAIFADIKDVRRLHQKVLLKYTGEPSANRLDFNVVANGAYGCTPKMHVDMFDLNAHVSYLTPLQWLSGVPTIEEWQLIANETLESNEKAFKNRILETRIGDVAFIKGLGPMALDSEVVEHARFATMPHRSSDKIKECGQIAVAIF